MGCSLCWGRHLCSKKVDVEEVGVGKIVPG